MFLLVGENEFEMKQSPNVWPQDGVIAPLLETSEGPCGPPELVLNHHNHRFIVQLLNNTVLWSPKYLGRVKQCFNHERGKELKPVVLLLCCTNMVFFVFVAPPCSEIVPVPLRDLSKIRRSNAAHFPYSEKVQWRSVESPTARSVLLRVLSKKQVGSFHHFSNIKLTSSKNKN